MAFAWHNFVQNRYSVSGYFIQWGCPVKEFLARCLERPRSWLAGRALFHGGHCIGKGWVRFL